MGGAQAFALGYATAAALLALWLDVRIASRRPAGFLRRLGHVIAALAVSQLGSVAMSASVDAGAGLKAALLGANLLLLGYMFLAGAWLLRGLAEQAHHLRG